MKNFTTLEVGKTYKNRIGELVIIIREKYDYKSAYHFFGDNDLTYTSSGEYWEGEEDESDLIELVESTIEEQTDSRLDGNFFVDAIPKTLICIGYKVKLVTDLPIGQDFTILKIDATPSDIEVVLNTLKMVGMSSLYDF